jgi:hypothetical protein
MRIETFTLSRKDIPEILKGKEVNIHVPENDEDWVKCLENGDLNRRNELARRQYVLDQQREAVAVALDADVTKMAETDLAGALAAIQTAADEYVSSGRKAGAGVGAITKKRAAVGKSIEDALADPDKADKARKLLAQLGIVL